MLLNLLNDTANLLFNKDNVYTYTALYQMSTNNNSDFTKLEIPQSVTQIFEGTLFLEFPFQILNFLFNIVQSTYC